jgi:hypothetical protein
MRTRQARIALAAAVLMVGMSWPALAQSGPTRRSQRPETSTADVDVDRLPLDLGRIQRELNRPAEDSETHEGLRLRYFLQIYGTAPELKLFTDADNLVYGPVPYGAPTHQEMLYVMTPQEYRAPVADFSSLLRWVSEKLSKKSDSR